MQDLGRRTFSSDLYWNALALGLMLLVACGIAVGLLSVSPVLIAAGVMALLGCAVIMWNPYLGILLFLTLVYTRPEQFFPQIETMRLPLLLSVFTLFAWAVQLLLKRETFRWQPTLGFMAAFGGSIVLSAFRLGDNETLVGAITDAVKLVCMFLLLQQLLNSERRVKLAIQWVVFLSVILAFYAIDGFFRGFAMDEHGTARAVVNAGMFDDPNDLAAALVIVVPVAMLLLTKAGSFGGRLWGAIALAMLVFGIYLCNSRGGMLGLGVAVSIFLVRRLGWGKGMVLGLLALGAMTMFGPDRFSPETVQGDDSALGRLLAWEMGIKWFLQNPLLGIGYMQFEVRHGLHAHNSFVNALAEGGILSALTWVGLYYWAILTLVRVVRAGRVVPEQEATEAAETPAARGPDLSSYAAALQAGLLASLTTSMFLSHTYRLVPLIPIAIAAALGAIVLRQRKQAADVEPAARASVRDAVHALMVPAVTVAGIALIYMVVRFAS